MSSAQPQILDGVRVLDLTRFLSGPQATLFLAGMGAEVIRIDDPAIGGLAAKAPPFFGPQGASLHRRTADDLGIAYLKRARGKKAVTLNLKSEHGKTIFFRLVESADVLVENFRVGVTDRLGVGYGILQRRNPRLIHCAITGYGATGPDSRLKAYDLMVQAATGLMSITGAPDGEPCKTGSSLTDGIASSFAVSGILAALLLRERTGKGQFIDVSMADCLLSLMLDEPLDCYDQLGLPLRQGNRIVRFSPFNTYPTKDESVAVGAATEDDWIALLDAMGRSDLTRDRNMMSTSWRIANNGEVDALVSSWTKTLSSAEVIERLTAQDVPCSPIRDIKALAAWVHLRERGLLQELVHPYFPNLKGPLAPGFPLKFSGAAVGYAAPAPVSGQHNKEIYGGVLGLSDDALQALAADGVI